MSAQGDQKQAFRNLPSAILSRAATYGKDAVPGKPTDLVKRIGHCHHRLQGVGPRSALELGYR
jgi:hypothetical protein